MFKRENPVRFVITVINTKKKYFLRKISPVIGIVKVTWIYGGLQLDMTMGHVRPSWIDFNVSHYVCGPS